MSPENTAEALLSRLKKYRARRITTCSSSNKIPVTKGARENRFRPGTDPRPGNLPRYGRSAIANVKVDHGVALDRMGPLLESLTLSSPRKRKAIPADIMTEAEIAERERIC
jgi:hypothetical protein